MRLKLILATLTAFLLGITGFNTVSAEDPPQFAFDDVSLVNPFGDSWTARFTIENFQAQSNSVTFYIPVSNFHAVSSGGLTAEIILLDDTLAHLDATPIESYTGGLYTFDLLNDFDVDINDVDSILIFIPQTFSSPSGGYQEFLGNNSYWSFEPQKVARFFFNQVLVKQESFVNFLPSPPNIAVPDGVDVVWIDESGSLVNFDLIYKKDIDLFGSLDTAILTWTFIVNNDVYDTRQFALGQITTEEGLPDDPELAGLFFHYWELQTRVGSFRFEPVNRTVLQDITLIAKFESTPPADFSRPPILDDPPPQQTGLEAVFTSFGIYDDAGLSFVFMIVLIVLNVSLVFFKMGISFIVLADLALMGLFAIVGLVPLWGVFIFSIIGVIALILLNGRGVNYE